MKHPYTHLADYQRWPAAMTSPAPGHINPALPMPLRIAPGDKVATMGSCFAQHIAKHIQKSGYNYLITEHSPAEMSLQEAGRRHYHSFSARYGNIYTARQAVQLFDRAWNDFVPIDRAWEKDGRYIDPFRPTIEPDNFISPDSVSADVAHHLACVKNVFLEADWIIFTLGLTEAWRSKRDAAVYPIAPGVIGGKFDPDEHEYVNFSVSDVTADIADLRNKINKINPNAKIILTVSPVPLMATYENRHVWTSTTYSKSVLRVAAEQSERSFDNIHYFPSFEIMTSPASGGRYYDDDLRGITKQGVNHVMRVFFQSCCTGTEVVSGNAHNSSLEMNLSKDMEILCDEELLLSGFKKEVPIAEAIYFETIDKQEDFDEDFYLENNLDIAKAVSFKYFSSGWDHYERHGRDEGRKVSKISAIR